MPMKGATPERLLARVNAHELAFRALAGRLLALGVLDAADIARLMTECLSVARRQQKLAQSQQQVSGLRTEEALQALFRGLTMPE